MKKIKSKKYVRTRIFCTKPFIKWIFLTLLCADFRYHRIKRRAEKKASSKQTFEQLQKENPELAQVELDKAEKLRIQVIIKVYMTRNFLSPSWKDLLKLYNDFFCSF